MATDKTTLKSWFLNGLRPLQAHFYAWIDSFWHKDEKIPITSIEDIEDILNDKADAEAFTNHLTAENAHPELLAKAKVFAPGELLIFKTAANTEATLQANDFCVGLVEGQFIQADYLGGNPSLLSSFNL